MKKEMKIDKTKEAEMPHVRSSMTSKIECLAKAGFTDEFGITENGLLAYECGQLFQPEDISILEHQRFEGISDPDDMSIMYVIETKSGIKGTVVAAFGTYGDNDLMEFMNKVPDKTIDTIAADKLKKCA